MAEDYYNHESSGLNSFSVEMKPEELPLQQCYDDGEGQIELKFVDENVRVKREDNNLYIQNLNYEDEGNDQCNEGEEILPDVLEDSDLNSTGPFDPLNSGTSGIYVRGIISTSEVIKTEQVNALDKFYDESECQEEEEEVANNYDVSNDPVDTLVDLDSDTTPVYLPISVCVPSVPYVQSTRFSCSNCDRTFSRRCYLDKHIASRHNEDERSFPCPQCTQNFHFQNNLELHIKSVHKKPSKGPPKNSVANAKLFTCTICHLQLKSKQNLTKHLTQHKTCQLNNLSVSKNEVGHSVVTKNASKNHWRPTPAKYKCEPCNQLFWKHAVYTKHIKKKHRPPNKNRLGNLKNHKLLKMKSDESLAAKCVHEDTLESSGEKKRAGRPRKKTAESETI